MSDLEATLAAARTAALELQRETITLFRPGGDGFDWDTGADTPAAATVIYAGPARVKPSAQSRGEEVNAGENPTTLREYTISVPWGTEVDVLPTVGDFIDVTTSPDARMVGLRLWATGIQYSSTATAWRITGEDRS
ncbi:DUF6093 family protein [Streptomyces sp. H27-H1]|uniref:DUF6093 family protein n=1 Tax=Streptomyces sp. H27-H1 TaxID=2996461 RepID=UPI00226E846B|nr:DUF6093 family protein [Streptomyces sp. H27-H1]MCY0928307.1 DUF6093 family protein [Streptomyces sp. H27-H1]